MMDIGILGTGNVAYHLAKQLQALNLEPKCIYGRNSEKLEHFRNELKLQSDISTNVDFKAHDFIILAVNDDSLSDCLKTYSFSSTSILIHVSGSVSLEVFPSESKYGVIYPLQTFSKSKPVDFAQIPLYIETKDEETFYQVNALAHQLSNRVSYLSSEHRLKLHLAAVFACNFTNYLYHAAEETLKGTSLSLADLNHLILETVKKAQNLGSISAQTGPAIRDDHKTMEKHMALMEENEELREIYSVISRQIRSMRS